ncbi:uncharacterized protein LOC130692637 [Daphnia carinata]|uniref:uncharacterized protein LOC130692637 n=1 Tax=Daphnia carinata TaxID=120202 RepID=UPI00257F65BB|nr:uncharacterized protein LOC130692637 [Daphnia carinata]
MEIAKDVEPNTSELDNVELDPLEAEDVDTEAEAVENVDVKSAKLETAVLESSVLQMADNQTNKQHSHIDSEIQEIHNSDGDSSISDDAFSNQHDTTPFPENNAVAIISNPRLDRWRLPSINQKNCHRKMLPDARKEIEDYQYVTEIRGPY